MSVIVAGTVRTQPQNMAGLRPHMLAAIEASRAEDGCQIYSFAEDVAEPGLIRVFEVWRDEAALAAHYQTPHLLAWRAACAEHGVGDRQIKIYAVASERAN